MMFSFLFSWLPLFLILILVLIISIKQRRKIRRLPPGPPKLPLIGNLHHLKDQMLHRSLWQLSTQYGPLMHLKLGLVPTLVVSSAKMAREVLVTYDLSFCSRPPLVGTKRISYNYKDVAFSPYGKYSRTMKKICVQELFSNKRVRSFKSLIEEEVSLMITSINQSSSSINLSEVMLSLVNNIICRIAFSKRYQDEVCKRSRFQDIVQEAQTLMGGFYFEDFFPHIGKVIDMIQGKPGKLDKNFSDLDTFLQEMVNEHLDPKRERQDHEDIIDVLLQIERNQIGHESHLTKDHIKAVLMDIFIAGTDTSSAALVWGMTELVKNPRVMKKAQEEIRTFVGKKGKVEDSDIKHLFYLNSIVKEIMRLHPPGPLLAPRETIKHCIIDGYDIDPKTRVIVSPWAIGRDPESWVNPYEFYPERFIDSPIDFKGLHLELIPLGTGRRGCPGTNLGPAIVEFALANLLYSFDWELPNGIKMEDIDMEEAPGLTTHKKFALCLVPTKYNWESLN